MVMAQDAPGVSEILRSLQMQEHELERARAQAKAAMKEAEDAKAALEQAREEYEVLSDAMETLRDSRNGQAVAALGRMADAAEEANRLAREGLALRQEEAERMREAWDQSRRVMERAAGMGSAPDWARISSQIARAMAERIGVDPDKLPEIPEGVVDIPGWLEQMRGIVDQEEEGPAGG